MVTDPETHIDVLNRCCEVVQNSGLFIVLLSASRIIGGSGNKEYFIVAGHKNTGYNVAEILSKEVRRNEDFFVYKPE
ncbi:MAG: hypothetical protein MZV65_45110 [Chromatiales bacterium]|nr:hypothetical protein [Chromatiales bacterium]